METLEINKEFSTYDELLEYEKKLCDEYIVILVNRKPTEVNQEVYGIEKIVHCGKR